jgi:signal transduction histidine kinase
VTKTEALPVLAEAADILSDQLGVLLKRLAVVVHPHAARLEKRFLARLEKLRFTALQSRALAELTAGAAARILTPKGAPADFFESVEYHAQRLAKLNVAPAAVVSALGEYDRLLGPVLKSRPPAELRNFQWVRDQLHFCVMLTLNNAYYHVREAETQAFYEMFWAEVESRRLDELLGRFLEILARFCRADRARLYLSAGPGAPFERRASFGGSAAQSKHELARLPKPLTRPRSFYPGGPSRKQLAEGGWAEDLARCWSVPMMSRKRVTGLIQFGFVKPYEWLPREQELLQAAAERCVLAAEKARLLDDLSERETQIRRLAERMLHVEEAERRRISRELHDQSGQDLLWIRLQMEMLENSIPDHEGGAWKAKLTEVRDMTEKTIVEIRRLIGALSPAVLEQLGLVPALRQLINRFRQTHTSRVRLQAGRNTEGLPKQLEVIVYRLVQECLNNVNKHSYCSNVMISVACADGILRLCVEDDGVGFRVEDAVNKPGSFGLAGIRERVALLGGNCEIESRMLDPVAAPVPSGERQAGVRGEGRRRPVDGRRTAAPPSGTTVRVELPVPVFDAFEPARAGQGYSRAN